MTFSTGDAVAEPTGKNTSASEQPSPPKKLPQRKAIMAVVACWLLVVFDGYDLIVYGTVQSSLLAIDAWGLTPATMGTIGSLASLRLPRLLARATAIIEIVARAERSREQPVAAQADEIAAEGQRGEQRGAARQESMNEPPEAARGRRAGAQYSVDRSGEPSTRPISAR